MSEEYHIPVLLHESIDALITDPAGIYVDATFGGGGHSREILKRLDERGRLIAFDQDPDSVHNSIKDERFRLAQENFRHMKKFLRLYNAVKVNGILADLGVSSHQFDVAERGFSTRYEAMLDMRMNTAQKISAKDILNTYSQKQLQEMFSRYGELRNARQLSEAIVQSRETLYAAKGISTTHELMQILRTVAKGEMHKYSAQVFQAIRIEVNDEMQALTEMLESAADVLKPGGRLVVISYHSLEDRMVKNVFKTGRTDGTVQEDMKGNKEKHFNIISKKPLEAGADEKHKNSRSRSAKMRVAERI